MLLSTERDIGYKHYLQLGKQNLIVKNLTIGTWPFKVFFSTLFVAFYFMEDDKSITNKLIFEILFKICRYDRF